jgi:AraC-like DNA-binding protein
MFWMLGNHTDNAREIVIIPDGRIDIIFSESASDPFHVTLLGLENKPSEILFPPNTVFFSISLKLLSIEYLLGTQIPDLLNHARPLPHGFWGINPDDLKDFEGFCRKVSTKIKELVSRNIDSRKQELFGLIYSFNGSLTVKDLSERVHWSSRQINRYFNQQFGISLKAYCNILRFRASFQQIKEGKLYPEQNFADQAHFIKEVKRYSGVVPRVLSENKNDRFLQFSTLKKK